MTRQRDSSPSNTRSCVSTVAGSSATVMRTACPSFCSARLGVSVSKIPATAFTISANAQYATPSPYGMERPCCQRKPSAVAPGFAQQACLADSRFADQGDQPGASLQSGDPQPVAKQVELGFAAHERRSSRPGAIGVNRRRRRDGAPHRGGLGSPGCGDRLTGLEVDRVSRRPVRCLGHEHRIRRSAGPKAIGRADGFADHLTVMVAADQNLARIDADPHLDGLHGVAAGLC